MRIAVTGAHGFLGWHARCALKARGDDIIAIGRECFSDRADLASRLDGLDAVLHLAGVNRADDDSLFEANTTLARNLTEAFDRAGVRAPIVFANSIQSGGPSAFGQTKEAAAEHLKTWGRAAGVPIMDVRLPNLFGEHGRPGYNSVVATFCYALTHGEEPRIVVDREVPLLHVQDAVDLMLDLADRPVTGTCAPDGMPMTVSSLLVKLRQFHSLYLTGDIPDLREGLNRALFNTYRSFCFPDRYPIRLPVRADDRGALFEAVRSHGGPSQAFSSSTRAGVTRGNHFHRRKVERFVVLNGTALISLRRLFGDSIVRFEVSGEEPSVVDMPTMWTHSLTNVGSNDLVTLFWADEIFNADRPDTFPEEVEVAASHT